MEWKPIETAPKDGTMVDLWVVEGGIYGYRATNMFWSFDKGWWMDEHDEVDTSEKYTHWLRITPPTP